MESRNKKCIKRMVVVAVAFLCLFIIGTASATDATTFPVDEAGIAAYVKVSDSIDLEQVFSLFEYGHVEVVNETYVIGEVKNADNVYTHLYVGADGWVVPYYPKDWHASYIVRWNKSSPYDPTLESVTAMNTLEELISRVCILTDIDYESIRSGIKYYDFAYPEANTMTVVVDMWETGDNYPASDSFKMWIPSDLAIYNSSWSHYTGYFQTKLYIDGVELNSIPWGTYEAIFRNYTDVSSDYLHEVRVTSPSTAAPIGVGWVFVYKK